MNVMALAIALSLLAVAGLIGLVGIRRRFVDERHSVQGYRRGIDTLRQMAEERARHPSALTALPQPPAEPAHPSAPLADPSAPSVPQQPLDVPVTHTPVTAVPEDTPTPTFDDLAPRVRRAEGPVDPARIVHTLAARGSLYQGKPTRRVTLPSPPGRGAVAWVTGIAAALVVAGGATALTVGPGSPSHPGAPAAQHQAVHPAVRPSDGSRSIPITLTPTAATTTTATYEVPTTADVVQLTASGPCWVEATDKATGSVLWMGTLSAGQSHSFPAAGTILIRLGQATNVTLAVSGTPVQLPAGFHSPFDVTFQAA